MKTIDFYNFEGSLNYTVDRPIVNREKKALKSILKNIGSKENIKMLEVGCGNGVFFDFISKNVNCKIDYTGIDYSEYQIKLFKERNIDKKHSINLMNASIEKKLPLTDNSFDIIYMGEIIEHLYNPDLIISECYRLLKKDGVLIITTPNMNAWYNRIIFIFGLQPIFYETSTENSLNGFGILKKIKKDKKPVGHVRLFNIMSISDLLLENKFRIIDKKGAYSEVFPRLVNLFESLFNSLVSLSSIIVITGKK